MTKNSTAIDTARVELLLTELRLPGIKHLWPKLAEQADKEGCRDVANLFRAAARAEQIHASNHAEVIRQLGAEPKNNIETPQVKTTRENLEAAIKGETYERDTMYWLAKPRLFVSWR